MRCLLRIIRVQLRCRYHFIRFAQSTFQVSRQRHTKSANTESRRRDRNNATITVARIVSE